MTNAVRSGFKLETVTVPLTKLLPTRQFASTDRDTPRYRAILASIREVGLVEALAVHPQPGAGGMYLLLDGHARRQALLDLGQTTAPCLLATDDEGFTYNYRINRLAPIQERRMIMHALKAGVSEERIARTLALRVETIRRTRTMLDYICPEALELLRDRSIATKALQLFRRVKPMRQIEMAELMIAGRNYSSTYARALLTRTPRAQLVETEAMRRSPEVASPEDLAKLEHEAQALERDLLLLNESYGQTVVQFTLARSYVKALLENGKVVRFLAQKHRGLLDGFQRILDATPNEA